MVVAEFFLGSRGPYRNTVSCLSRDHGVTYNTVAAPIIPVLVHRTRNNLSRIIMNALSTGSSHHSINPLRCCMLLILPTYRYLPTYPVLVTDTCNIHVPV